MNCVMKDMTSAIVASRSFSADPSDLLGKPREMPSKKMKLSHTGNNHRKN